ncbi:unnamed protein product [Gemmata massiliana]|uniref:Uncharacterized protein n=1 Tax=Gemmata massiliana TaxID=1210884 RepID=A0A6P2CTX6_9BACT|nr:type II secretion system protein M [Gemmata massiliana]VTR91836.1 unnamed protein product [Gemmata massiliana]
MTPRDQKLALILIAVMVLGVGGAGGYLLVWSPLEDQRKAELVLQTEISELKGTEQKQATSAKYLAAARARSLPADSDLARNEYGVALGRLLDAAGAPKGYIISMKPDSGNSAKQVPEISKGKPAYTRIVCTVQIKKADMWVVKDFLKGYYDLGLLHQITHFSIKKEDEGAKNATKRNDLTVDLTTEAIIMDGAENRRTLLRIPNSYGAAGGGGLYAGMTTQKEYGRGVTPQVPKSVLAAGRDYSLIVLKDPFNGPLAPPPPFKLSPIKDVKIVQDERPSPVKVAVSGEGAQGTKVTATASGKVFAEGALKVDPKTLAIELPKTSAGEGTETISVVAVSADGKVEKTSFKVTVEAAQAKTVVDNRDEVSGAIFLTMVTFRSDGTAWARIFDSASRLRYEIDAKPTGVSVVKEWIPSAKSGWRPDLDHKHPPGVIVLSDEGVKTHRTFQIVGVDFEGLIIADLKPNEPAPSKPKGTSGFSKGGVPKPGPTNPLTAVAGNVAVGVAVAPPKLYRWTVGQSLATIKQIPDSEAQKILKQAADSGPMFEVAAAGKE